MKKIFLIGIILGLFLMQQAFAQENYPGSEYKPCPDGDYIHNSLPCPDQTFFQQEPTQTNLVSKFLNTLLNFLPAPFQNKTALEEQQILYKSSYDQSVQDRIDYNKKYNASRPIQIDGSDLIKACASYYTPGFLTICGPNQIPDEYIDIPAYCPQGGRYITSCKDKPKSPQSTKLSQSTKLLMPCMPIDEPPVLSDFEVGNNNIFNNSGVACNNICLVENPIYKQNGQCKNAEHNTLYNKNIQPIQKKLDDLIAAIPTTEAFITMQGPIPQQGCFQKGICNVHITTIAQFCTEENPFPPLFCLNFSNINGNQQIIIEQYKKLYASIQEKTPELYAEINKICDEQYPYPTTCDLWKKPLCPKTPYLAP